MIKTRISSQLNNSFTNLFGYYEEDVKGRHLEDLVIPDIFLIDINEHYQALFKGLITNIETVRKTKDNRFINVNIYIVPFVVGDEIIGAQITYRDIDEKIKNKQEIQLFKEIIQNNIDGVIITDENKRITWVNKACENITQYSLKELLGESPKILCSSIHNLEFYNQILYEIDNTGEWQGVIWNKRKDDDIYSIWLHIIIVMDNKKDIKNYVGIFKEINDVTPPNLKKNCLILD